MGNVEGYTLSIKGFSENHTREKIETLLRNILRPNPFVIGKSRRDLNSFLVFGVVSSVWSTAEL